MGMSLHFSDYIDALRGRENQPASLGELLRPFGIIGAPSKHDEFLLVGHIIDEMQSSGLLENDVNAEDVVEIAFELGMSSVD